MLITLVARIYLFVARPLSLKTTCLRCQRVIARYLLPQSTIWRSKRSYLSLITLFHNNTDDGFVLTFDNSFSRTLIDSNFTRRLHKYHFRIFEPVPGKCQCFDNTKFVHKSPEDSLFCNYGHNYEDPPADLREDVPYRGGAIEWCQHQRALPRA